MLFLGAFCATAFGQPWLQRFTEPPPRCLRAFHSFSVQCVLCSGGEGPRGSGGRGAEPGAAGAPAPRGVLAALQRVPRHLLPPALRRGPALGRAQRASALPAPATPGVPGVLLLPLPCSLRCACSSGMLCVFLRVFMRWYSATLSTQTAVSHCLLIQQCDALCSYSSVILSAHTAVLCHTGGHRSRRR